jgi:hypothetical protein
MAPLPLVLWIFSTFAASKQKGGYFQKFVLPYQGKRLHS